MLNLLIKFSLTQRLFVSIFAIIAMVIGARSWLSIPVDAFPEISPTQVKIVYKLPGMNALEIESQVTRIIETELLGIPAQQMLRSTTKYSITDITIDFKQGTDIYWARQQVNERLLNILPSLPANISGGMAPMSTPLSEVFMFTIESPNLSLIEKRELLDWQIRPLLRTVSGVADINSLGGYAKTFAIAPDNLLMQQHQVSFLQLREAIVQTNQNGGIGRLEKGNDTLILRTEGKYSDLEAIKNTVVKSTQNKVIRLSDVAHVDVGSLTRYGAVTKNSEEAVQGLIIALKNSNTAQVVAEVKSKLRQIEASLPQGTSINVFYDRSNLINTAISTITSALGQAIILVIVLLALFLGDIRSSLVVSLSLPMSALLTFIMMKQFNLSANLMSLGGLVIAIGMLVDSSVVIVENILNRLANNQHLPRLHVIYRACKEVAAPVFSGTIIIIIVFSPLLMLTGLEGKLFTPVALTIVFAMLSALLLSLTVIPILASLLLKNEPVKQPKMVTLLQGFYSKTLAEAIKKPMLISVTSIMVLILSGVLFQGLGKSFMPVLDEGDIIVQLEKSPSISLQASLDIDKQIEATLLKNTPEIVQIVARTGSDELGLDPMGLNETDVFMELAPKEQWRFATKAQLIEHIRQTLAQFPGVNIGFTQPIQMRVSEMLTGSTGDISIKVFGNDIATLSSLAEKITALANSIEGASDVQMALIEGGKYVNIKLNPEVASQFGLTTQTLSEYLKSQLEGLQVSTLQEGNRVIPIVFNSATAKKQLVDLSSIQALKSSLILMPDNSLMPLEDVASIGFKTGPLLIEREKAKRFASVSVNVDNRDVVSYVNELEAKISSNIKLPSGFTLSFGGEFESQQRATQNLLVLIPVALILIFIILFTTFKSLSKSTLIIANIPFALMGGVIALYISNEYLSVPASVGFVALLGVAVLNAIVMISYFEQTKMFAANVTQCILDGASRRLRPVLMTATTAMFGLLPLVFATGPGAEIQKPLAIVVIGGLITSTITTLYLLPIFYGWLEKKHG
ncbi:MAG TPA: CusA/CzcA family heavy metal efflux RND transporter [Pseudoalteromonas sp.]|jgi:cobalt-zinc-cadmium resistance protein CzcA|uniref:efflux RND transporter permease subunit n=1 Tax=Pseudoalteromonas sp. BSi20439 TaxID=420915 RepID=UPI000231B7C5|nr:efflux RND transporter permease subunit [Pseudoalteromonas sp. BSi20439]GAA73217.1 protein HelA [Pseudoalteromonas sp. BSi20439]HCP97875.1 CusA/CzcA family heavy metal efflux RND transporter [Pseudoalteromonas sp.]|tara:strand:+ start:363 stop:3434 length:3072 start_codon:yes stop_codon:yes gene_type:complete